MYCRVEDNVRKYVDRIFDQKIQFGNEEICKFGEAIADDNARLIFAKELNSRRSKCLLDVTSYHKLLHSVALTLYECSRQENYTAGSILMNMAFTYHYLPKGTSVVTKARRLKHSSVKLGNSDSRSMAAKCRCCFSSIFFCFNSNSCSSVEDEMTFQSYGIYLAPSSGETYLYESLKNHIVWKSSRFWEEIFFAAVGCERTKCCTQTPWSMLDTEQREVYNLTITNITFSQICSFLNNMKLLELPKTSRIEFLKKQCEIGGIYTRTNMYFSILELV